MSISLGSPNKKDLSLFNKTNNIRIKVKKLEIKKATKIPEILKEPAKIKIAKTEKRIFSICKEKSKKTNGLKSFFAINITPKKLFRESDITKRQEKIRG